MDIDSCYLHWLVHVHRVSYTLACLKTLHSSSHEESCGLQTAASTVYTGVYIELRPERKESRKEKYVEGFTKELATWIIILSTCSRAMTIS